MEKKILQEAINLKKEKKEFSIVNDLNNSKNYIYQPDQKISKDIELFAAAMVGILHLQVRKKRYFIRYKKCYPA